MALARPVILELSQTCLDFVFSLCDLEVEPSGLEAASGLAQHYLSSDVEWKWARFELLLFRKIS